MAPPTGRLLPATLLGLGLLAVLAGLLELLASQPPGAPLSLLALPGPWATLRASALGHALAVGLLGALGWLPEPGRRRFWAALLAGLLLAHGALLHGALHGQRLVVLWPMPREAVAAVALRWLGQALAAGALLGAVAARLRSR